MSDSDETVPAGCAALMFVVGVIIGGVVMVYILDSYWKNDSVTNKTGEFYLDKNNQRQWRWIK